MKRPLTIGLLVALLLAALGLRWHGLDSGLPLGVEPDSRKYVLQLEVLRAEDPSEALVLEASAYPGLVGRVAGLAPAPARAPAGAPLEEHLRAAGATHRQMRAACALLSLLLLPATYLLARRFFARGGSLFATALVATSVLGLSFSQQARPHAPAAALVALAVLACVHLRRRATLAALLLAALACGAALGTLHSGVATLFPLAVAAWLGARARGRRFDRRWFLAAAVVLGALFVFYRLPPASRAIDLGFNEGTGSVELSRHKVFVEAFDGTGFARVLDTFWGYEPVLLGLGLLGLFAALFERRRRDLPTNPEVRDARRGDLAVVLAYALPYLFVIGLYARTYERFVLPLLPFAALLATLGWTRVLSLLARRSEPPRALACVAALVVLVLPGYACWRLSAARAAPDTTHLAADWVREHLDPEGAPILVGPYLDLPLPRSAEGLLPPQRNPEAPPWHWPWILYQQRAAAGEIPGPAFPLRFVPLAGPEDFRATLEDAAAFVRTWEGDQVVLHVFAEDRIHPSATLLRECLRDSAELLARFSPDARPDYSEHPFAYQEEVSVRSPHFLSRLLQVERGGPVIEVYDLTGLRRDSPPGGD